MCCFGHATLSEQLFGSSPMYCRKVIYTVDVLLGVIRPEYLEAKHFYKSVYLIENALDSPIELHIFSLVCINNELDDL